MFMNLGAFMVVALLSRDHEEGSRLGAFAGLGHRNPWLAAAMSFFLSSLAGLPPTAGFTAKIFMLASTVGAGYAWLRLVLIVGTAISIYVYLKIVFIDVRTTTGAPSQRRAVGAPSALDRRCRLLRVHVAALFYPLAPSDISPAHALSAVPTIADATRSGIQQFEHDVVVVEVPG